MNKFYLQFYRISHTWPFSRALRKFTISFSFSKVVLFKRYRMRDIWNSNRLKLLFCTSWKIFSNCMYIGTQMGIHMKYFNEIAHILRMLKSCSSGYCEGIMLGKCISCGRSISSNKKEAYKLWGNHNEAKNTLIIEIYWRSIH